MKMHSLMATRRGTPRAAAPVTCAAAGPVAAGSRDRIDPFADRLTDRIADPA